MVFLVPSSRQPQQNPINALETRMVVVERSLIFHDFHLEDPQSIENVIVEDACIIAFDRRLSCIEKMLHDKDLILTDDIVSMDVAPTKVSTIL